MECLSLSDLKLRAIIDIIKKESIDVAVLLDTQTTPSSKCHFNQLAIDLYPDCATRSWAPLHCNSKSKRARAGFDADARSIGGQQVIVSPRWVPYLLNSETDPSTLHVLSETNFLIGDTPIVVMGTYWPIPHHEEKHLNSLHTQLGAFLNRTENIIRKPIEWIKDYTGSRLHRHLQKDKGVVILAGDFNSTWGPPERTEGANKDIAPWALEQGLTNPGQAFLQHASSDLGIPIQLVPTRYDLSKRTAITATPNTPPSPPRTSTIDHILVGGDPSSMLVTGFLSTAEEPISSCSDHRPIWINILLPRVSFTGKRLTKAQRLHLKRPELDLQDDFMVEQFTTLMSQLDLSNTSTPEELLLLVQNTSVNSVRTLQQESAARKGFQQTPMKKTFGNLKQGRRPSFKQGYSPQFIANKLHLTFLMYLMRRLYGGSKSIHWNSIRMATKNIADAARYWRDQTLALVRGPFTARMAWQHLEAIPFKGPQYYLTLSPADLPTYASLRDDILAVRSMMHGAHRTAQRLAISEASRRIQEAVAIGQLRRAINSLLHRASTFNDNSVLLGPDGSCADPSNTHGILQRRLLHPGGLC